MSVQLFLGVIAAGFVILLVFLIPLILHAKKTLMSLGNFINTTQESLSPLLSELKISVERLNRITEDIEDSTKNVQHFAKTIGETGELVEELNNFIKKTGLSFSIKTASLGMGIKTALATLAKGIIKKGGNADEQ
ncbi:MAG: hypothetical protein A3J72_00320 [Nitrospirae bacterium RIFCSPHIGHO2_02_FULL_40_19]|nr:MAG: hypothetical protein A3J72_00320 [Nitrospirae bacterium RIFCSPHIGHO2_02_FULL_40_19]